MVAAEHLRNNYSLSLEEQAVLYDITFISVAKVDPDFALKHQDQMTRLKGTEDWELSDYRLARRELSNELYNRAWELNIPLEYELATTLAVDENLKAEVYEELGINKVARRLERLATKRWPR